MRETSAGSPAPKSTVVPGPPSASSTSGARYLAIGELTSPSARKTIEASPLAPQPLTSVLELRDLAARQLRSAPQVADGRGVREHAELGAAGDRGRVLDLEPEPKVGLVGSVTQVGLVPLHARERRLELDAAAFLQMRATIRSISANSVVEVGERHLDVELRQLLQPVGAQILVPEAARDLVVALEAGDHEQLLVDLRALRQARRSARAAAASGSGSRGRPRASACP